jgi:SAM-dependent methyltransferase
MDDAVDSRPWQLRMFNRSIKKKAKLASLKRHLGPLIGHKCLLITNGNNTGALNYYLQKSGGEWVWAELDRMNIPEMEELLKAPVLHIQETWFDLPTSYFDCVLIVDVHEHLIDPGPFNKELMRVTKKGGKIIVTTPSNSEGRFITKIRNHIGMTKEIYGHVREGYNIDELNAMFCEVGIEPCTASDYSKLFTESLEIMINFVYVKGLARNPGNVPSIAPTTKEQMKLVSKLYKIYSFFYPIIWLVSRLDTLLPFEEGYAVIVEGRKA